MAWQCLKCIRTSRVLCPGLAIALQSRVSFSAVTGCLCDLQSPHPPIHPCTHHPDQALHPPSELILVDIVIDKRSILDGMEILDLGELLDCDVNGWAMCVLVGTCVAEMNSLGGWNAWYGWWVHGWVGGCGFLRYNAISSSCRFTKSSGRPKLQITTATCGSSTTIAEQLPGQGEAPLALRMHFKHCQARAKHPPSATLFMSTYNCCG